MKQRRYPKLSDAWIGAVIFTWFLCLGMAITRMNQNLPNVYFGADNGRAYWDLAFIKSNHYRIKVHPLFLFLVQPLVLLVNGITQDAATSIILVQSGMATINVFCLFSAMHVILKLERRIAMLLCGVYLVSFSTMLFTATPETFLYASLYLVLFWYWVIWKWKQDLTISKRDLPFLLFFGITTFGVTLTNYAQYIIGFLLLLIYTSNLNKVQKLMAFGAMNGLNGICIILLAKWQQICWKGNVPVFWSSLKQAVRGSQEFEEFHYMDWNVSVGKLFTEWKDFWGHTLIAGNITDSGSGVAFLSFSVADTAVLVGMCVLFFAWLSFGLFPALKNLCFPGLIPGSCDTVENRPLIVALVLAWGYNLGLHYIYGSSESFIYSQHYLFLVILIQGILLTGLKEGRTCIWITAGLCCLTGYLLFRNLCTYREMVHIIKRYGQPPEYSIKKTFMKTIMASSVCMGVAAYIKKGLSSLIQVRVREKSLLPIGLLLSYGLYNWVVSVFILVNNWKIS